MMLPAAEAMELLKKYSIPYPKTIVIEKSQKPITKIKYPVVLKVDSPDVIHKSDLGVVFIGLKTQSELEDKILVANQILSRKNITDYHFIVQEMIKGTEIIIGMKRDRIFGPIIVFGLGGIFVELLKDISMRVAPITKKDSIEMINEIKAARLLEGYRNSPKVNKEKLADLLVKISHLSIKEKTILEIDFNPVIVNEDIALVADARFINA
jgi:acyl-CoA synthetase (NDP forming)